MKKSLFARVIASILVSSLAFACAPAIAQNVNLSGANYQFNSVGIGTAPTGTPGDLSFLASSTPGVGAVGEQLTTTVAAGSAVSLTTATAANVATLSLTPGTWEIVGACDHTWAGTTATVIVCGISGTTATQPTQAGGAVGNVTLGTEPLTTLTATFGTTLTGRYDARVGPVRAVVVTAATNVFLVATSTFSAGTVAAFGTVRAVRVR